MRDWSLSRTLRHLPHSSFLCPRCGLGPLWIGYPWPADPSELPPEASEDLSILEDRGVWSLQELLAVTPTQLQRTTEIPLSRLSVYFDYARMRRTELAFEAWMHLHEHLKFGAERVGYALALQMAEQKAGEQIEVIIDMADELSFDELLSMSPEDRMRTRRSHAAESQANLIRRLELREDSDNNGYLQVWLSNQIVTQLTSDQIIRAAREESVSLITLGLPVQACMDQAMPRIAAAGTRSSYKGSGQTVALLDSGVDSSHVDLAWSKVTAQKFYVGTAADDEFGHGTHLAGVVASCHAQYQGVAPEVDLWSYRILDASGKNSNNQSLITALQDLVADAETLGQLVVANCSFAVPIGAFATPQDYNSFCKAFDDATSDLVVVTAAGNSGPNASTITGPGSGSRVITVGASVNRPGPSIDFVSGYSSRGPAGQRKKPDLVAPGGCKSPRGEVHKNVSLVSSRLTGCTLDASVANDKPWPVDTEHYGLSGTSQATAMVSGVCALLLEAAALKGRKIGHADIRNALMKSADPLGFGRNEEGTGLINVDKALNRI